MTQDEVKYWINKVLNEDKSSLATEVTAFTNAVLRNNNLNKLTVNQLASSWQRWKLERITHVKAIKSFRKENKEKLKNIAVQHATANSNNNTDSKSIEHFSNDFSNQLIHLTKDPLPEHVAAAWQYWQKNKIVRS